MSKRWSTLWILLAVLLAPAIDQADAEEMGTFARQSLLDRFDADRNGELDAAERRQVRDAFGMTVPMLPDKPFDYSTVRLPAHVDRRVLESADNTPSDNAVGDAGAALGRVLFYDTQLSKNNTVSCSSCHLQRAAFSDPRRLSVGYEGGHTRRNAMPLANLRYSNIQLHRPGFFWDERAATLEAQVLMPIQDSIEMGMPLDDLERRLEKLPYYPPLFEAAFGTPAVTRERIAQAIAQFMRSMISMNSRFDQAANQLKQSSPGRATGRTDYSAPFDQFTDEENLGKSIFLNGRDGIAEHGCAHCHIPPTFGMTRAMNNGLALKYDDPGLGALGRTPNDPFDPSNDGKFKAPSLRNIALTAPYMHDGRFSSLEQVIDHYSDSVHAHENLGLAFDEETTEQGGKLGLRLSTEQKTALVAFLKTLTDDEFVGDVRFSDPFLRVGDDRSEAADSPVKDRSDVRAR